VKILEPILELPINGNEFWLLKLKNFHIASKGNTSEDPYENFEIHLHEGSFEYFPERFGGK
jgi:vacuolar protein sorting-associated protein 13A/C